MGNQETSEDTLVGEDTPAATHRILPSLEYHHLWESLIYDSAIKKKLLKYAIGTVLFSKMNVDSNLVTWNKVVLLHGKCRCFAGLFAIGGRIFWDTFG
jgi:hypothetical protein